MEFLERKSKQLSRKDKSNEQRWDRAISELCNKINSKREYYTTSSCAGRIILVKSGGKSEDAFLFKTHEKIDFKILKSALKQAVENYKDLIYFKLDSCILHVACLDLKSANKLLIRAKIAGWKRSGIMAIGKRILLELISTERIELPIADKGKFLVDDNYLKLLVKEANEKLGKVRKKIKKMESLV